MALLFKAKGEVILGVGLIVNSIGLITHRFEWAGDATNFVAGFCAGLGVTLILVGAVKIIRTKKEERKDD